MSHPFNSKDGPILVDVDVTGPVQSMSVTLILDTGATTSILSEDVLLSLGHDLAAVADRVSMTTGSLVTTVPRVVLTRLTALGRHRFGFPVLAHTLPETSIFHGLLGLDSLRDGVLTIDFGAGRDSLA